MKKKMIAGLFLFMGLMFAFTVQAQEKIKETVLFSVKMDCHKCEQKIMKNIAFEKGVVDLKTDLKANTVAVVYNTKKTDTTRLIAAFKKIGYEAMAIASQPEKKQ